MKRRILGTLLAAVLFSITVWGAAVWVGSQYIETFQNGMLFGNFNILKVTNGVPEFEDASGNVSRLDDRSKKIFFQEDYEGASVSFTCGTNLTAADETTDEIAGLRSLSVTQGATPPTVGVECVSPTITLEKAQIDKFFGVDFYTTWTGNDNEMDFVVYDQGNNELVRVPIVASTVPKLHSGYGQTLSTSTSIRYEIEVAVQNASDELIIDDIEFKVDPLTPTDIYASSEWQTYTPSISSGFGSATNVSGKWKRDGDTMHISVSFVSGTVAASLAYITLPSGYEVDTTKINNNTTTSSNGEVVGWFAEGLVNINRRGNILVHSSTSTSNLYFSVLDASTANSLLPANGVSMTSTSTPLRVLASVPIAGWSNTAQGVVVKNVESSDIGNTNVFSASFDTSGVVTREGLNWIDGNGVKSGGANQFTTFTTVSGAFSSTPVCTCSAFPGSNQDSVCEITTTSISSGVVTIAYATTRSGTAFNEPVNITCQRGTDFVKESEKVYTVPVDTLTGNTVRGEGNGANTINSGTTDIPFAEVTDSASAWDGDSYTVQKNNSIVTLSGAIYFNTGATNWTIDLFKNGTWYKRINTSDNSGSSVEDFEYVSSRGEFAQDDVLSIRQQSGTNPSLVNDAIYHYININERYGDRGIFLGKFGQPTCYVKDVKASGTAGGSYTSGSYVERTLNTTEGDCSFLSLSSSDFTLQAGTYLIEAKVPFYRTSLSKAKVYNVTDSVDAIIGKSVYSNNASNYASMDSYVAGQVSISAPKAFDIRFRGSSSQATNGLGNAVSFGDNEVYTVVKITKVR